MISGIEVVFAYRDLNRHHRGFTIKDATSTKVRGSSSMNSAGSYQCPRRGKDLRAPVFRLGRRNSHASLRIPLQEVLEDVRRQRELRRARQASQGELPSLRQHRRGAGHHACRGEDIEEVLTVFTRLTACNRSAGGTPSQAMASSPSTPLGEEPSTTPGMPRPGSVSATTPPFAASSTWLSPLPLVPRFGRVCQTLGALWMNARQRIDSLMADRAAFPLRIGKGCVAVTGKHRC
jgi:hypothetical protein